MSKSSPASSECLYTGAEVSRPLHLRAGAVGKRASGRTDWEGKGGRGELRAVNACVRALYGGSLRRRLALERESEKERREREMDINRGRYEQRDREREREREIERSTRRSDNERGKEERESRQRQRGNDNQSDSERYKQRKRVREKQRTQNLMREGGVQLFAESARLPSSSAGNAANKNTRTECK
ncbi:Protein of unknown function [Gryllus bimaculatus]|nr:Protein of unknown function [Gryllus bimaculatus]